MISVAEIVTHFPENSYSIQAMVEALIPYCREVEATSTKMPAFDEDFFRALGVERRSLFCNPFVAGQWSQDNAGQYPVAREAAHAYRKLMADREPLRACDKVFVVTNTVDAPAPNMGYAMLAHLRKMVPGFVAPQTVTLSGEGCSGYISGLRQIPPRPPPERRAAC